MTHQLLRAALVCAAFALPACGGKSRSETFAVLDKYRLDYGKCEVMAQSKGQINGQEPWLAATVCRTRHRQAVVAELNDAKSFDKHFDDWKKEHGPKAVEDARSAPSAGDNDCPNGAGCLNRCRAECEAKHGKMMDSAKIAACAKTSKKPEDCVSAGSNPAATSCFRSCRGI